MAYLQLLKGGKPGRIDLSGDRLLMGRNPECNLVLDTGAVSRHHAEVVRTPEAFVINDLQSRNGTYVNGNRITNPTPLTDNARIKICEYLFTFHSDIVKPPSSPEIDLVVTDGKADTATIMSTLDASTSNGLSGVIVEVRPEVKLRAMLEISRNLGSVLRMDDLLPKILDSLFKIFPQADRGFILLRDEAANRLIPKAVKNRRETGDDSLRISRTIVKQVMENGQAILLADASSDQQFNMSQSISDFRIRSIMCVPLVSQQTNQPFGIIQIYTEDRRHQFNQEDLDLLVSVAGTAAIALENARMHEDLLTKARIERELQFAAEVQRGFLPADWPALPGYGFYAFYEAAYSVGGDYYGFVELPGKRLAISLGDVSGKGMPAAMLMARLSSDIRFAAITEPNPGCAVRLVNRSLSEAGLSDKFVTLLYMVLDSEKHEVSVVNAGHMPIMIRKQNGDISEIGEEKAGLPLNVAPDPDYEYQTITFPLEPGTTALVYTDGVSEAMNNANELFGFDRLRDAFKAAPGDPAEVGEAVIREVRNFAAGRHQSDDITLICFGRNA
jgi:sigma-B regulation protein RsbU (phosphoserine phosphatase)